MEHNIDYVANKCPIPIGIGIGIIILGMFLKLYVALIQMLSRRRPLLAEFFVGFFLITEKPTSCTADTCNCRNNGRKAAAMKPLRSSSSSNSSSFEFEDTLSRKEVEMVMERLGLGGVDQDNNNNKLDKLAFLGAQDIARVFEEQEPSFDEVKEAFNVFDTNGDGLIDAAELRRVLHALGVDGVSETECRRVIMLFNHDGVIDLKVFTKIVEKSLS